MALLRSKPELRVFSLGGTHSRLGWFLRSRTTTGAHPSGTQWGAEEPCAPLSAEDPQMEQQDNTWAITVKHSGLQVSGKE